MSPLRTAVFDGTAWRARSAGGSPPPETFILGVTEPTAANTHARDGVTMLAPSTSTMTISAPGTYSGIRQPVRITSDNVTLADFDIQVPAGAPYGVFVDIAAADNVRLEHGRVWGLPEDASLNLGVRVRGGTSLFRVGITGVGDGMQVYTSTSTTARQVEIAGCYIDDLQIVPDPMQDDLLSHNDCVQIQGNVGVRIAGSALHGGRTSAVIATTDISSTYLNLEVTDCWVYPYPTEGSGINMAASVTIPGLAIKRNRVAPRATRGGELRASAANRASAAAWGMVGASADANTWTAGPDANTYMDTGLPVPITNG